MPIIDIVLTKIFGSQNERELKRYADVVQQVNALEPQIEQLRGDLGRGRPCPGGALR